MNHRLSTGKSAAALQYKPGANSRALRHPRHGARLLQVCLLSLNILTGGGGAWGGELLLSEFMATNGEILTDSDGDASDWIELFNAGGTTVSLAGWSLTDNADEARKWSFPDQELPPGAFLVVFASGKNRRIANTELHTNFKLSRAGEFLALTDPEGRPCSFYAPRFPELRVDSSFGLPMERSTREILPVGATARLLSPEGRCAPSGWAELDFDDSEWLEVLTGVGFDRNDTRSLDDLIATDIYEIMRGEQREATASAFLRIPFTLEEDALPDFLQLQVNYDSGFIAFINGIEVARRNAAQRRFNISATTTRPAARARRTEEIALPRSPLRVGLNMLAVQALNDEADSPDFLFTPALHEVAVAGVGEDSVYFSKPSPGRPNHAPGEVGIAEAPHLTVSDALFSELLTVEITTAAPDASVHYTTDGSAPDDLSPRYEKALELTASTTLKARVFRPGLVPSEVVRGTYIAAAKNVLDFASNLPVIVVSSSQQISANLSPVQLRIVEAGADGQAMLNGSSSFAGEGVLKTRGSSTLNRPKKSFSLEIRDEFGRDRNAALFGLPADSDWVLYGPHQDETLLRNVFMYRASNLVGRYAPRTRFFELFLQESDGPLSNEDYVGVYVLVEKIKRGTDRVDIEKLRLEHNSEPEVTGGYIFKRDRADPGDRGFTAGGEDLNYVDPKEGEITEAQATWLTNYLDRMADAMRRPDFGYEAFIEVDSWIDHHLMQEFTKNGDAYEHSTYYYKARGGRIEVGPIWDFNYAFGHGGDSPRDWTTNRRWHWWGRLLNDPSFLARYKERWKSLRLGAFQTERLLTLLETAAERVGEAQARNFERWPDSAIADGWQAEVSRLRSWIEDRLYWMDDQLIPPPTLNVPGGRVPLGTEVRVESAEEFVYYTLNGADPRDVDGAPHPDAIRYKGPVTIASNTNLRMRAQLAGTLWSGRLDTTFVTNSLPIVISEIMYKPGPGVSSNLLQFIELHNVSDQPTELSALSFDLRPSFNFAAGEISTLEPGQFGVIVKNFEAFSSRYDTDKVLVLGEFSGTLSGVMQTLRLLGPLGEEVFGVRFEAAWHPSTRGKGHSLVLAEEEVSVLGWTRREAWRPSHEVGGSPGRDDVASPRAPQLPGDWNQDARLNLTDAIRLLSYLGGLNSHQPCDAEGSRQLADVDGSDTVDITDAAYLLNHIFMRGPAPTQGRECVGISGCPPACEP